MIDPRSSTSNADYAALLLRVSLGLLFLAHGGMKVFTFTIPGTVQYFETIGYPGFFAYLASLPVALVLAFMMGQSEKKRLLASGATLGSFSLGRTLYVGLSSRSDVASRPPMRRNRIAVESPAQSARSGCPRR